MGNDLSNLLTAIDESRISILVLSQNYASSTWCLRELVEILECVDAQKQILVPIFYQVDPSRIRKLKASFGQALAQHELHSDVDMEELQSWKTALTRAANLSGWDSEDMSNFSSYSLSSITHFLVVTTFKVEEIYLVIYMHAIFFTY